MPSDEGTPGSQRRQFDVHEYSSQRLEEGKALTEVHSELSSQLRELRRELHNLINLRYEDFLGLGTSLNGIDTTIKEVHAPLHDLSEQISATHGELTAKLDYLDMRLAYRTAIREKKQMLRVFIDLARLLDRVNAILAEAAQSKNEGDLSEHVKCLERAAVDFSQIKYFIGKGGDSPFVQQAETRMRGIEKALKLALYTFFVRCVDQHLAYFSEDADAQDETENLVWLSQCLRAYSTIDEQAEAESVLRNRLVKPFVHGAVAGQPGKGMGMDSQALADMLERIIGFVSRVGIPLVDGVCAHLPTSQYSLKTQVFWHEISDAIMTSLPLLFVPGMPDRFHRNYQIVCRFVRDFSDLFKHADSISAAADFARDEHFVEFHRKWQLSAYFAIRKTQIIDAIEGKEPATPTRKSLDRIRATSPSGPSRSGTPASTMSNRSASSENGSIRSTSSEDHLVGRVTVDAIRAELGLCTDSAALAVWAIRRCWSADVYLAPLAFRFWQLSIQVVLWFGKKTESIVSSLVQEKPTENSSLDGDARVSSALFAVHDVIVLRGYMAGYISSVAELLPVQSPLLSVQSPTSASHLGMFGIQINGTNRGDSPETSSKDITASLTSAITAAFSTLEGTTQCALDFVSAQVVAQSCTNIAAHLRRTTSHYRHTNREPPTDASGYISKLFAPLEAVEHQIAGLQAQSQCQQFADQAAAALREAACKGVSKEVASASADALATISKTEASLQRLRKTRDYSKLDQSASDTLVPKGVDLRGEMPSTDNEKIRRQIWLDLSELDRIIRKLQTLPHFEFTALLKQIAPFGV